MLLVPGKQPVSVQVEPLVSPYLLSTATVLTFLAMFQLIAMVAKSVHIPGSRFRRLPNPCGDTPPYNLNAAAYLSAFAGGLKDCPDLGDHVLTQEIKNSFEHGRLDGLMSLDPAGGRTLEQLVNHFLAANRSLEDERAERFFAPVGERDSRKKLAESRYNDALIHLMDALHAAVKCVDQRLMHRDLREEVPKVLASHFATLFEQQKALSKEPPLGPSTEENIVKFYFDSVRWPVVRDSRYSASSTASTMKDEMTEPESPFEVRRNAIWLALMFKMWSWLFLHEFNPVDKMIERSEFQNSRLPVYIG